MELYLLVIYDVSDDDLRNELASFLKSRGLRRVQRSAFLGSVTPALVRDVEAGVRRLVKGYEGVNVQLYLLTPACYGSRVVIGDERYEELLDESGLIT